MSKLVFAPQVAADFSRIYAHLIEYGADAPETRLECIRAAIDILIDNPLMGRPVTHGRHRKRELVIGKGTRGYIALYRYAQRTDTVEVLAARSQRELRYTPPGF